MKISNEFWISLHELARAVSGEGTSPTERKQNIIESLLDMHPTARREVASELAQMMAFLPTLHLEVLDVLQDDTQPQHDGKLKGSAISLRDGSSQKSE